MAGWRLSEKVTSMRCIYCLEEKEPKHFAGREHVIPQAFGVFDTSNFVLKCVCDACNKVFGETIDLKLARDSIEGIARIQVGLKPASQYKSLGRRSTSRVQFLEGPMAGGWGYNVANPDGDVIAMMAFPQVSFARSEEGPWHFFRADLDEIPTKDELIEQGLFSKGDIIHIRTAEIPVQEAMELLQAKGFDLSNAEVGDLVRPEPGARLHAETVGKISHPEFRAMTKIALNYLAAVVGWREASLPVFEGARRYVRFDEREGRPKKQVQWNPWFLGRRGHYISLSRLGDMIVAQVSILLQVQYIVALAEDAAATPFKATAHFFDLATSRIIEIEPLPIVRGRALKAVAA